MNATFYIQDMQPEKWINIFVRFTEYLIFLLRGNFKWASCDCISFVQWLESFSVYTLGHFMNFGIFDKLVYWQELLQKDISILV